MIYTLIFKAKKNQFQGLSKRDRTTFSNLKDFVSANDNWKRLRQHFSNTKLPCIPYLGKSTMSCHPTKQTNKQMCVFLRFLRNLFDRSDSN